LRLGGWRRKGVGWSKKNHVVRLRVFSGQLQSMALGFLQRGFPRAVPERRRRFRKPNHRP